MPSVGSSKCISQIHDRWLALSIVWEANLSYFRFFFGSKYWSLDVFLSVLFLVNRESPSLVFHLILPYLSTLLNISFCYRMHSKWLNGDGRWFRTRNMIFKSHAHDSFLGRYGLTSVAVDGGRRWRASMAEDEIRLGLSCVYIHKWAWHIHYDWPSKVLA